MEEEKKEEKEEKTPAKNKSFKPGGRPKKEANKKRSFCLSLRFSETEKTVIKFKAEQAGTTPSNYIRQATLQGHIKPRLTKEEMKLFQEIAAVGNNLNQLAKAAHQQNFPFIVPGIVETLNKIRKALKSYDNKDEDRE